MAIWGQKSQEIYGKNLISDNVYLSDPKNFQANWQEALQSSIPWTASENVDKEINQLRAWEACKNLGSVSNLLV